MKIKIYAKLCALPISIVVAGFGLYYFIFDSFNQYQQHIITITQAELQSKQDDITDEHAKMREELDKIKQSANADFIHNVISTNLNRISSYVNIELKDTNPLQKQQKQEAEPKQSEAHKQSETMVDKKEIIDYVPYRQIHTHELPNAFSTNMVTINRKIYNENPLEAKNAKVSNKNTIWAIPVIKETKIYDKPDTQSKVLAINKNGIKMQVIATKPLWVRVRYAIKKESFIEGYIPTQNIRFL